MHRFQTLRKLKKVDERIETVTEGMEEGGGDIDVLIRLVEEKNSLENVVRHVKAGIEWEVLRLKKMSGDSEILTSSISSLSVESIRTKRERELGLIVDDPEPIWSSFKEEEMTKPPTGNNGGFNNDDDNDVGGKSPIEDKDTVEYDESNSVSSEPTIQSSNGRGGDNSNSDYYRPVNTEKTLFLVDRDDRMEM